jgi:hypothetical protein
MRLVAQDDFPEWEKVNIEYFNDDNVRIEVNEQDELYAAAKTGIFKSIDKGENWSRLNMPDSILYYGSTLNIQNNYFFIQGNTYNIFPNTTDLESDGYNLISYDYGSSWEVTHFSRYSKIPGRSIQRRVLFVDKRFDLWCYESKSIKKGYNNVFFIHYPKNDTNIIKYEIADGTNFLTSLYDESTFFLFFESDNPRDNILIVRSTDYGNSWDTLNSNSEGDIYFDPGKSQPNYYSIYPTYSQKKLYITMSNGYMVIDIDNKTYEVTEIEGYNAKTYRLFKLNEAEFYSSTKSPENNRANLRRSRDAMKTWEDIPYSFIYSTIMDIAVDSKDNIYACFSGNIEKLSLNDTLWTKKHSGLYNYKGAFYFQVNSKSEILTASRYYNNIKWIDVSYMWEDFQPDNLSDQMRILPNDKYIVDTYKTSLLTTEYPFYSFYQIKSNDSITISFMDYNWDEHDQNRYLGRGYVQVDGKTRQYYYLQSKDCGETWEILENAYLPTNNEPITKGSFRFNKYDEFIFFADSAKVYLSKDYGKSWNLIHNESSESAFKNVEYKHYLYTVYNYHTGVGFVFYYGHGFLLLTRDHGRTWTKYLYQNSNKSPLKFMTNIFTNKINSDQDVILTDNTTGYFYMPTQSGIYRSTDSLKSFHNMSKGLLEPSVITALRLGNDGRLYAMNYTGLWRTKKKVVSSVENTSEPILSGGQDLFIFPNPASEYIEIAVDINPTVNRGVDEGSDIKIFNTLGECVMTVETRHAVSLPRIDISHLPIGVYFVRIGNYSQKFVVVK